jgi:hypothetical protein
LNQAHGASSTTHIPNDFEPDGIHPDLPSGAPPVQDQLDGQGIIDADAAADAAAAHHTLVDLTQTVRSDDTSDYGTFSPRAQTFQSLDDGASVRSRDMGGRWPGSPGESANGVRDNLHGILGDAIADGVFGSGPSRNGTDPVGKSTTSWLADSHGVRAKRLMYLSYYFPFARWIRQYRWSYLQGDLIAAITMASFYIPMALSYADNLGHIPPINGLYSFVFNPLIYAFFGTCPQMVVGPEAAGSLLVGNVVRSSIDNQHTGDDNGMMNARIAGVVTGMAGGVIFIAGLTRLGFLDSVLSKPFLRGFISAIGIVILADQLIPEMGLLKMAKHAGVDHGSSWEKIVFLFKHAGSAHALTCWISFGSFAIIMVCR